MATTIKERPYRFSFSQNEIRYILYVSNLGIAGTAVEVELYYHEVTATGAGNLLKAFALTPDKDGNIYCQIRDYLNSIVQPELPAATGNLLQPVSEQVKYYYIRYRQVTTADASAAWTTEAKRIVLFGGIEKMKLKRNNYFASYLPANKTYLTWQPTNQFVFVNQVHYLTYLRTESIAGFQVEVRTVFTDGTVHTQSDASAVNSRHLLWRINAGAEAWGLDLLYPLKKIFYYELTVKDGSSILANPHRFYIEYNQFYSIWHFNYFNSLGGIDRVSIKGEVSIGFETTGDDLEHISYNDPVNTDKPQEQFSQANIVKKDNLKGDAGWSKNKLQQEALTELMLSRGIYELIDGRWIKILNLKKSQDIRLTTDKKWSWPVEWTYGYADTVFTPKTVLLGDGNLTVASLCTGMATPVGVSVIIDDQPPDANFFMYYATWGYNVPYSLGIITTEISTDAGTTWQPIDFAHSDNSMYYNLASVTHIPHLLKVKLTCPDDETVVHEAISANAACLGVSLPGGVSLPDGAAGVAYSYSITLSGTSPFTLSSVVKPAWMNISISGNQLNFTGTPGAAATGITISFTINNCSSNTANFSDTINVLPAMAPGGDASFNGATIVSSDSEIVVETIALTGTPGATLTIKVVTYTNTNGGSLKVNGSNVVLNDTFTVVLNSSGNATFNSSIYGIPSHTGTIIRGIFQIIAASSGSPGSPNTLMISKTF